MDWCGKASYFHKRRNQADVAGHQWRGSTSSLRRESDVRRNISKTEGGVEQISKENQHEAVISSAPKSYKVTAVMRLPYIPDDPKMETAEDQAVVERVKERRGGKLIALDKALLHAPPVADGWNGFLKAIRTQTTLPASIRELAISRVAVLNHAWYDCSSTGPTSVANAFQV